MALMHEQDWAVQAAFDFERINPDEIIPDVEWLSARYSSCGRPVDYPTFRLAVVVALRILRGNPVCPTCGR